MKVGFSLSVFLLVATIMNGQSKKEKPIVLTHADSLVAREIDGEAVREVIGSVEFIQDSVIVRCDRAVHHPSTNRADLYGHVTVLRDTVTLTAPRGVYDGDKKQAFGYDGVRLTNRRLVLTASDGDYLVDDGIAHFRDGVKVVDSTTTITGNELTYFENDHKSIVVGNVKVVNSRDNATMVGGWLEHLDDKRYSMMLQGPRYFQIDTSAAGKIDTLVIISRQMESTEDSTRRFIGTDSVQLVRGGLSGKCGRGVFYPDKDLVELQKEPIIWYEESQVTGDSIHIELKSWRLDRVFVHGEAFAVTQSDSLYLNRFDQMTSQEMILYFSNDKLERIEAEGTATSLYFLYDRREPNGVNKASGDRIVLYSKDGRAESIKVQGGTEGQYVPEKLVSGAEGKYDLAGFNWRTDRPRLGNGLTIVATSTGQGERTKDGE
jgi:lipopolysaccharide export system protein LptA